MAAARSLRWSRLSSQCEIYRRRATQSITCARFNPASNRRELRQKRAIKVNSPYLQSNPVRAPSRLQAAHTANVFQEWLQGLERGWLLKLARCPHSLAATLAATLITRTARCLRQLPSCVAVYLRDSRSRRVLCCWSLSSIPDLWQQEAVRALQQGKDVVVQAPTGSGKTYINLHQRRVTSDEWRVTSAATPNSFCDSALIWNSVRCPTRSSLPSRLYLLSRRSLSSILANDRGSSLWVPLHRIGKLAFGT